jgi:ABC-2 type transport system ATP-binding protein
LEETAIQFEGVSRQFGRITAVHDLSLAIPVGSVFGFLGPNGAGKTTTVRMMLGLLAPTGGRIRILGLDPLSQGEQVRRQCGVVLDQAGLYERLTAYDNLVLAGRIAGLAPAEIRRRAEDMLERVGLTERSRDKVAGFSKGMRQKLAIARALLTDPRVLVLDEPTSGLDPENIVLVRELLVSLAEEGGRTIFLCTHLLAEAERICDRVAIIQRGRIQATGTLDELGSSTATEVRLTVTRLEPAAVSRVPLPSGATLRPLEQPGDWHLTVAREADVEVVVERLVGAGAGIRAVIPERETLEAKYLKIVGGMSRE